jgi:hypothetical protein
VAPTPVCSPVGRLPLTPVETSPTCVAIGVAKGVNVGRPDVGGARQPDTDADADRRRSSLDEDVEIDSRWMGDDYAVPTSSR